MGSTEAVIIDETGWLRHNTADVILTTAMAVGLMIITTIAELFHEGVRCIFVPLLNRSLVCVHPVTQVCMYKLLVLLAVMP